jgi:hypothetical protein
MVRLLCRQPMGTFDLDLQEAWWIRNESANNTAVGLETPPGGWRRSQVAHLAGQGDDFGVVHEPVDHGGGDDIVAEDLNPAVELLVAERIQRVAAVRCGLSRCRCASDRLPRRPIPSVGNFEGIRA